MHDFNPYASPGIDRLPTPSSAGGDANRVTVRLTIDDLAAFNALHDKQSNKRTIKYFVRWLIVPLVFATLGFMFAARNRPGGLGIAVGFWTAAACFLVMYPGGRKRAVRRALAQASARNEHMALQEVAMTLLEEGIFRTSAAEDVLRRWQAVHDVVLTPGMGVIYIAPNVAYLVPRRFFASDAHYQEFMRTTLTHWKHARGQAT